MAQTPTSTVPIAADSSEEEDSTFGDTASSTQSLSSSIYEHVYENGRRYHSFRAGQYVLPNDEKEKDRLDLAHHRFRLVLKGELCITKLKNPQSILDIGTGTGIWAIDVGDEFPMASVVGTDLSPIQPLWVPPNVRFEIDDCTDEWTFPINHFDFIHIRSLGGSVKTWPELLKRCYHHLKPGGQLEVSEIRAKVFCDDGTLPADGELQHLMNFFQECCMKAGLEFDIIPKVPAWLEAAGFVNLRRLDSPIPLGTWPKDPALKQIGAVFSHDGFLSLSSYTAALFSRVGGWSEEATHNSIANARVEMAANKPHIYTFASFISARKPVAGP